MKSILCAVALVAVAAPAFAQTSHSERHCGWTRGGAYACSNTTESADSKTSSLCISGTYDSYCKTATTLKEQPAPEPAPLPAREVVPFDAAAMERAHQRQAENPKRPAIVVCGPDHRVGDHWEPSCR